ncbi:LTA synthase family protein [Crenothrix sp.]|uniref:LTA synthase family protein n=1 Tax=Crenothrix sp. TaxID=3100433 RepID=UPI00374D4737
MFLLKLEELIWRYRRLLIVFLAVIAIQVFEFAFLHFKYTLFTGGFLQPFSYQTFVERLAFILISLWFDLALYGTLASLWFFVAGKLKRHGIIIYYYFTVLIVISVGIWLGLRFRVLSYFSDTINLQIIKSLGGGSLQEALMYAANEIALFTGAICAVSLCVIYSLNALSKNKYIQQLSKKEGRHSRYIIALLIMIVITPVMTFIASNNDFYRYGLEKKISYQLITDSLDKLSDVDFDGFGIFSYPQDKVSFNADIYPGALDIPYDGIDQDGFLGDAITTSVESDYLADITPKPGKNIVLIVLETARFDLLEQQINNRYVAPTLRALAQQGASIPHAYSHTGYTTTSLKAIFRRQLINSKSKISLIPFLRRAGYQFSIISAQDESFGNVAEVAGMKNADVDYFDARTAINDRVFPSTDSGSLRLSEERIVEQFQTRVQHIDFSKPQFFYVNIQAGHFPYAYPNMATRLINNPVPRSDINPGNKDWVALTYWNAMANADWAVGEIVKILKGASIYANTTLVILGDHGESLFDDGFLGHGHVINDFQTKIPLIINDPNIAIDNDPVGQTDVAELMIRSALGEKAAPTIKNKTVFQLVGNLSHPIMCAHIANKGVRTVFDFRSEMFYFSDLSVWKTYQDTLLDAHIKDRAINLLREWESLRWREFVENQ